MASEAIQKFISNIERLIAGEPVDLYKSFVNATLERIGTALHYNFREPGIWYDGSSDLIARKRKAKQIEFSGTMWVMQDKKSWREPFIAIITDKRVTKQGFSIIMKVGDCKGEAILDELTI